MATIVLLDAGPLGTLAVADEIGVGGECRRWLRTLLAAGVVVLTADVSLYEVRRELKRRRAEAKLVRLSTALEGVGRVPVSSKAWELAEDLWAETRRAGLPTAPDDDLDGDVILAAVARTIGVRGDEVIIASQNVGHLNRFPGLDAREWRNIL